MRHDPNLGSYGSEQDDDLPRQTIPDTPVIGERYMQEQGYGWIVFDWSEDDAGNPEPVEITGVISKEDARLLVFGPTLVAACQSVVAELRDCQANDNVLTLLMTALAIKLENVAPGSNTDPNAEDS